MFGINTNHLLASITAEEHLHPDQVGNENELIVFLQFFFQFQDEGIFPINTLESGVDISADEIAKN
jgi:hypothetical protein